MANGNVKRASLDKINRMDEQGLLHHDPNALEGPPPEYAHLPDDFWDNAKVVYPKRGGRRVKPKGPIERDA